MASKRERSPGVYELRVYDPTAKSRQRSRIFRGSAKEANKALARFETEIEDARKAAPAAGTFADLLERWLAHTKPNIEKSTWNSYRRIADRLITDLGDLPLAQVTVKRLDAYYRELLAENIGTKKRPKYRSANTVGHYHAVIRRALGEAVRWGELTVNPARLADPPRISEPERNIPSLDDADELVRGMAEQNPELGTFLYLLLTTGLRRGEGVALRWQDVDLETTVMRVHRAIVVVNGELVEKDTKTHQARYVDLDEPTVAALRWHRYKMEDRAKKLGAKLAPKAFVFSDSAEGLSPWHPDTATKRWRRYTVNAGHPGVRVHDLRHAMATAWLEGGIPVHIVSKRLGHAKTSTTTDIYAHVSDGSQAAAAAQMARPLQLDNRKAE